MTALEAHIMTLSLMWHEPFFLFIFPPILDAAAPGFVRSGSSGQGSSGEWITLRRLPFRSRLPSRLPEFGGRPGARIASISDQMARRKFVN